MGKHSVKKPVHMILFCIPALILLILFIAGATRMFSGGIYRNIRESTTESVKAITSDRARMLDKTLELLQVQIRMLAARLSGSDSAVTGEILKSYAEMDPDFIRIVAFSADGSAVSSDGTLDRVSEKSEVYRQAFAGEYGVTDTFIGTMGYKEVNIYAPLYHGTRITGGVYINLDAEVLRSSGTSTLYDSSGYSYLLKQDGTILLAPSSYSYAQIYRNIRNVLLVSKSSRETAEAFMTALENGDSGNAVLDFSGEMQILCFEPLTVQEGWYYVSALPLALVENNGQEVIRLASQMSTLFSLLCFLFLLFLSAIVFLTLRTKWKNEINEGRVYKAISENIDTAIFIMDQHTRRIRHAFENTQGILGIPAEKIQGGVLNRSWLAQMGLPSGIADMVEEADRTSQPATTEVSYYSTPLGKETWMNINVSPLHLKGRIEYMVAFTDITENKRLMEELRGSMLEARSASAAKSSFLANMSHDIRTPMNAIMGMTDIAIDKIEEPDRVLDCLQKIRLSGRHLKGLINDILDMSKIESGKLSLNPDLTRLPEMLEGIMNIVQIQANEKQQQLVMVVGQVDHESVLCDSVRLNQVLLNILANAVKFTPEGGMIRFHVEETASDMGPEYGRYRFQVKDSGIGMSEEFQSVIFESFSREKDGKINKIEGSGLGMAISKWIVDQMNGTIQVFSRPGQGSEFVVTVPFLLSGEEEQGVLPGFSCLLADADGEARENAVAVFRRLQAGIQTVSDLDSLQERIAGPESYTAILLGRNILGGDPAESIRKIRACVKSARTRILMTAYDWPGSETCAPFLDGKISPLFFRSTLCREISRILSPEEDAALKQPDQPLKGVRVLLAEDNELNREICITLLQSNGLLVEAVEDGQQCLERFLSSPAGYYQIILTDIQMPVMNGYESARQIRESSHAEAKTIPILAVTADAFSEDIEAAKKAGMNGHISKPLEITRLIAEMKKHCPAI